jgi:cell division protein YceG involved in septum cleavage
VVEIIVRIFKTNKRPMSVKEISKDLLKEKMVSPNTILLNLQKYKTLFERVDKGVYQLVPSMAKMDDQEIKDYIKSIN